MACLPSFYQMDEAHASIQDTLDVYGLHEEEERCSVSEERESAEETIQHSTQRTFLPFSQPVKVASHSQPVGLSSQSLRDEKERSFVFESNAGEEPCPAVVAVDSPQSELAVCLSPSPPPPSTINKERGREAAGSPRSAITLSPPMNDNNNNNDNNEDDSVSHSLTIDKSNGKNNSPLELCVIDPSLLPNKAYVEERALVRPLWMSEMRVVHSPPPAVPVSAALVLRSRSLLHQLGSDDAACIFCNKSSLYSSLLPNILLFPSFVSVREATVNDEEEREGRAGMEESDHAISDTLDDLWEIIVSLSAEEKNVCVDASESLPVSEEGKEDEEEEMRLEEFLPEPRCVSQDEPPNFSSFGEELISKDVHSRSVVSAAVPVIAIEDEAPSSKEKNKASRREKERGRGDVPTIAAVPRKSDEDAELMGEDEAYQRLWAQRKASLERQAEEKARATFHSWQRDHKSLQEIIDGSLKEYMDLYERAHALRLQFEDERNRFTAKILSLVNSKAPPNIDQIMYHLEHDSMDKSGDVSDEEEKRPFKKPKTDSTIELLSLDQAGIPLSVRKKFCPPNKSKQ